MLKWSRLKYPQKSKTTKERDAVSRIPGNALDSYEQPINGRLEDTIALVKKLLGENDDFVIRPFHVFGQFEAGMLYFENYIDPKTVNEDILKPLMYVPSHLEGKTMQSGQLKDVLLKETLYHSRGKMETDLSKIVEGILRGETAVLVQGLNEALLIDTRNVDKRSIDQPATEQVIRGSREGFIEPLGTNLTLLRYRLPTPNFRVKTMQIGRITKSKAAVCYIEGIANPALVREVMDRLSAIDIDGVLDVGYLEQLIEDHNMSPFPQVQNTERPDKAVASMLEGRVAILIDGSPFALIVPSVFSQFYQTMDDYSERFLIASLIRFVRLVALLFSLIVPSIYVSVISFNPELLPTEFAVAVAGGRAGVPFPALIEVLIIEISMEVLREATLRLPQLVGGALSIVGVLVVGEAAVSAGFASPITVVVIALATIGSFATPAYNAATALRMLRFPLTILAGTFGLYGVMVGLILIINHMLSLKSFGVPYISPVVPGNWQGIKDSLIRAPLWWMPRRPAQLHTGDPTRLGNTVEAIKQPPSNTLDPVQVGNQRWDSADGVSSRDHSDASNGDSD
ncbi:spore germination protein [Effusibacillus lacus]|uniref:Spore germination protein n=1 Tax=Effusibacillus lacus TaxID=1348429 RepID=A0A292YU18_9BACL|nr:spore germination protein [Effusibacillus lacus]TCS73562.1 spore germination protein KA [Effusibacillus lacus]GAX91944.1 spore germination protein [Effusibacillus lacus]